MNQCTDLDIAAQCKHDSMGILGESHIQVDNSVGLQAFQKHKNTLHDRLNHGTQSLDRIFLTNMDSLWQEEVQL